MPILYPLALPDELFAEVVWGMRSSVGMAVSPFTFSQQAQRNAGQQWFGELRLPIKTRAQAAAWEAWMAKLNGREGTFLLGDTNAATRGTAKDTPGTPVVDGGSQSGAQLAIRGAPASATGYLLAGDYISIGDPATTVAKDAVSGGTDGTINGATPVDGRLQGGYSFDGVDDWVNVGDVHDFAGTAAMSVECWVFANNSGKGTQRALLSKWDSVNGWLLFISSGADNLLFRREVADSVEQASAGVLDHQRWVHCAATYDGATVRIYIDGSEAGSVSSSGSLAGITASLAFGATATPGSVHDGMIDDVRIWNDQRTAAEIADNRFTRLAGTEAGLVGYWRLDDGYPRLHRVLNDVDTDGSGLATIDIWPRLRESAADGTTVVVSGAKGRFRLGTNEPSLIQRAPSLRVISFPVVEAL